MRELTRRVEHVMGMPISLAITGRHAETPEGAAAWSGAVDELRTMDAMFSTYREDSWISRVRTGEVAIDDCPAEVREVLRLAEAARADSNGAFDIDLPQPGGGRLLDANGIVKGWATERAATHLARLDDTDFCLSAGGDMVCSTQQAGASAWRIGIEDPLVPARVIEVIELRNGGVATSGLIHRGAHIIDPRSGSTPAYWASATVIAPSLTDADIDATAAFVLGPEAPAWLAGRPGRSAILVRVDGSIVTV